MAQRPTSPTRNAFRRALYRAFVEVGFILFLFYANLLMGEFTAHARQKTLEFALADIFTPENFTIGLISALIGYLIFEALRSRP